MSLPAKKAEPASSPLCALSSRYTAWCWARDISSAVLAHQENASKCKGTRIHDKTTPFAVHPLSAAILLLGAPDIDDDLRATGFYVLLFHDLETCTGKRPNVSSLIYEQIRALRCLSRVKDKAGHISWSAPREIRLCKLFEEVQNLYDDEIKHNDLELALLLDLMADVEAEYGNLKILRIAKALLAD